MLGWFKVRGWFSLGVGSACGGVLGWFTLGRDWFLLVCWSGSRGLVGVLHAGVSELFTVRREWFPRVLGRLVRDWREVSLGAGLERMELGWLGSRGVVGEVGLG